jgi:hypothetical protein
VGKHLRNVEFEDGWNKRQADRLTKHVRDLSGVLNGGVTFRDNITSELASIEFAGPIPVLSFATAQTRTPLAVVLCQLTDGDGVAQSFPAWQWSYNGAGRIETTAFSALSAGNYTATMLIVAS